MILLRYDPAIGQLVDAEGKPIGVVCVPKVATAQIRLAWKESWVARGNFWARFHQRYAAMLAAARPDLTAATVKVPERDEALSLAHSRALAIERHEAAVAAAVATEPVAWALEYSYDGDFTARDLYATRDTAEFAQRRDGGVIAPLYTAPPADDRARELLKELARRYKRGHSVADTLADIAAFLKESGS